MHAPVYGNMLLFASLGAGAMEQSCEDSASPQRPEIIATQPRIFRIRSLLSVHECEALIEMGLPRLVPSQMGMTDEEDSPTSFHTSWRNSSSITFTEDDLWHFPLLRRLRRRFSDVALMHESLAEPLQIARYRPSERYGLHTDSDIRGDVLRIATVLVYLSDGFEGGETIFPRVSLTGWGSLPPLPKMIAAGGHEMLMKQLNNLEKYCDPQATRVLRVRPRQGDALLFFSAQPDGSPDPDSIHGACPPTGGDKWVIQQWFNLDGGFPSTRRWPPSRLADDGENHVLQTDDDHVPAAKGNEQWASRLSARILASLRDELGSSETRGEKEELA